MRLILATLLLGAALFGTALMTADERKFEANDRALASKFNKVGDLRLSMAEKPAEMLEFQVKDSL